MTAPPPLVDVTVAVHSAARPIARIVGSILEHTTAPVRVNVVAHNIDPSIIRDRLRPWTDDPRVRVLELRDGIASPAGPMNLGIACSTAPFIVVAGSDDELAPGAIDSWLALQHQTSADVVLARIQLANGLTDPYPPVRNGRRTRRLNPRKDRLHYRSAPLGLINRQRHGHLRFTSGLRSGEDLAYTGSLWFSSANIAYDLGGPAYVINADAGDRVTSEVRSVDEDFAFLDAVEQEPWFTQLAPADLTALVVKYLRMHVFDAVHARTSEPEIYEAHRDDLRRLLRRLRALSPQAFRLLSRADAQTLLEIESPAGTYAAVCTRMRNRQRYASPAALLPRSIWLVAHRQGPLRTLLAGFVVMHRR